MKNVECKQHAIYKRKTMDLLRNQRGNLKKYLETNENRNTMIQYPWDAAKAILRVKFIKRDRCLLQYSRKVPNKQYKLMLNGTRKIWTKPNVSKRKEIIKINAEINEIKTK